MSVSCGAIQGAQDAILPADIRDAAKAFQTIWLAVIVAVDSR